MKGDRARSSLCPAKLVSSRCAHAARSGRSPVSLPPPPRALRRCRFVNGTSDVYGGKLRFPFESEFPRGPTSAGRISARRAAASGLSRFGRSESEIATASIRIDLFTSLEWETCPDFFPFFLTFPHRLSIRIVSFVSRVCNLSEHGPARSEVESH